MAIMVVNFAANWPMCFGFFADLLLKLLAIVGLLGLDVAWRTATGFFFLLDGWNSTVTAITIIHRKRGQRLGSLGCLTTADNNRINTADAVGQIFWQNRFVFVLVNLYGLCHDRFEVNYWLLIFLNDWRVLDGCHFLNQDHILYSQKFNIEMPFSNVFLPHRLEFRRVNFLVSGKRPLYLSVNSRVKQLT